MFESIAWIIVGTIIGAGAVAFWDRIKEWATRTLGSILYGINQLVEVFEGAFVYFIKERNKYYKKIEVFTEDQEIENRYYQRHEKEQINKSELPQNILDKVKSGEKIQILEVKK